MKKERLLIVTGGKHFIPVIKKTKIVWGRFQSILHRVFLKIINTKKRFYGVRVPRNFVKNLASLV